MALTRQTVHGGGAVLAVVAMTVFAPSLAAQRGGQFGQPAAPRAVTTAPIPGVVSGGGAWTIAWQGPDNADGLVGTDDGGLLFAQEQSSRIRKLSSDGALSVYAEKTGGAGSIALDTAGRLIAVQRTCTDPGLSAPCGEPTAIAVIHPERERKVLADA